MKTDEKYLLHILQAISLLEDFLKDVSKAEFMANPEKQFAVVRGLEIIGEGVKNISSSTKKKNPDLSWKDIAGTRDVLIHAYFSVDYDLVWIIVKDDVPKLKMKVEEILKER